MNPALIPTQTINNAIDFALKIGDRDECFIKHVGHTLAAIYAGNGYKNPVDYYMPGYDCEDFMEELYIYWEEVESVCNAFGKEEFRRIASLNPNAFCFDDYYIELAVNSKVKAF